MNRLLINLNQPYTLQEVKKNKYDTSGRAFYCLHQGVEKFWLKAQIDQGLSLAYQQFKNEKKYYQQKQLTDFLLPYQYLALNDINENQQGEVLVTPYTHPLFKEPYPIDQKIKFALNVVQDMHQENDIHGDLKPSHFRIFMDRAVLIDFDETHCQRQSLAQPLNGTPRYMAPELFHGHAKTIQSDLYALGIILYEWLQNKKIPINNYHEWANFHCQHNFFQDIEHIEVLQPYKALLYGLLNKSIDQRFKSISCAKKAFFLD